MRMLAFILVLACLSNSPLRAASTPATPAAGDEAKSASTEPAPERKICRVTTGTGSIMRKRMCRSAAEWAAIDGANTQNAEHLRDLNTRSTGSSPTP